MNQVAPTIMERLNDTGTIASDPSSSRPAARLAAASVLILCVGLGWAAWLLPEPPAAMAVFVWAALPDSGVQNPVTAVLLNFRGYDTLLEVAVLLLSAFAALAIRGSRADRMHLRPSGDLFLSAFSRLMAPLAIVIAGCILWVGKHAPGGAFQAGSILAAIGILAVLTTGFAVRRRSRRQDLALVLGLFTFCAVGLGTMGGTRHFLQYPTPWAGALILLIESAAALSIAAALVALFTICLQGPAGPAAAPASSGSDR
jgi:multisubunit Na+/H+ antiporter MnhB subunit